MKKIKICNEKQIPIGRKKWAKDLLKKLEGLPWTNAVAEWIDDTKGNGHIDILLTFSDNSVIMVNRYPYKLFRHDTFIHRVNKKLGNFEIDDTWDGFLKYIWTKYGRES